jgi:hypothetical protein
MVDWIVPITRTIDDHIDDFDDATDFVMKSLSTHPAKSHR